MADITPENNIQEEQGKAKQGAKGMPSAERWHKEIRAAQKHLDKFWRQGEDINRRFLDKRDEGEEGSNKLNLFTTNTGILMSTLYARFPKPLVKREFDDFEDDVARVASMILERVIKVKKRDDFDRTMKYVVQDRLVPGLGQIWFRYEPTIVKAMTDPIPAIPPTFDELGEMLTPGTPEEPAKEYDKLVDEAAIADYVYWKDFLWSPCRIWEQCRWVGRRLKMNKEDAEKRFGKEKILTLSFNKGALKDQKDETGTSDQETVLFAEVFEIWDKRKRSIVWVSLDCDYILDEQTDLYGLENFFPCPRPLRALTSTTDQVPRADFLMIQDQYNELDEVNNRITILERAVKVVGVYDGTDEEIKQIFSESLQNMVIAKTSFRQFMEKGGFKGAIDWIPIEAVVKALEFLRSYRQDLIQQIYELSGISDIMRGATKASETLGAQQLKAQYGGVRLQFMQMDVAEFVEEALQIKSEIIKRKFQPQTILTRSNIMNTPDKGLAEQAVDMIKNDPSFEYRIEVKADSMAVPEFNAERDARMDFMRSTAEILTAAAPLVQQDPASGVLFLKIIQWAAGGFRVARDIEGVLDEALKSLSKKLMTPQPPQEPPIDVQAKAAKDNAAATKLEAEAQGQNIENAVTLMGPMPKNEPPKPPGQDGGPPKTE